MTREEAKREIEMCKSEVEELSLEMEKEDNINKIIPLVDKQIELIRRMTELDTWIKKRALLELSTIFGVGL